MAEKIEITIETGNAAFEDNPGFEVARILRRLADRLQDNGIQPGPLRDINGNACGAVTIKAGG